MAPVEPKRRVKSIKNPVDYQPIAKIKKPKVVIQYSRAYINKLLRQVLNRRANSNTSVRNIYQTYRRMIKMACELVARRHRNITLKDAHIAMAKMIPREVVLAAIRGFRLRPEERAVAKALAESSSSPPSQAK